MSTDLSNSVEATKNGIATIQSNTSAATIATVAATLKPQYQAVAESAKSAVHEIEGNALPLSFAFRRTNACKNL